MLMEEVVREVVRAEREVVRKVAARLVVVRVVSQRVAARVAVARVLEGGVVGVEREVVVMGKE